MTIEQRNSAWRDALPEGIRRSLLLGIVCLAILILLAFGMFNVVAVILACALLMLLARTVGDWLVEFAGHAGRTILFAVVLSVIGWHLLSSESRRMRTATFLNVHTNATVESTPTRAVASTPNSSSSAVASESPLTARPSSGLVSSPASIPAPSSPGSRTADEKSPRPEVGKVLGITVVLVPRASATGLHLQARLSGAVKIDGMVDFLVNGHRVARVKVGSDGNASALIPNLPRGTHRLEARFIGAGELGDASSRVTFRSN